MRSAIQPDGRVVEDIVEIVDAYGVARTLIDFGEGAFEGELTGTDENGEAWVMPYWLPHGYVWECADRNLIAGLTREETGPVAGGQPKGEKNAPF